MKADDLGELVVDGDLELGLLSEEEYQALWADRALEDKDGLEPAVLVALKSLLSSERAELVDGEIVLGGFLGLIRFAADSATLELDVDVQKSDSFTWSPCGPVLLQREWSPPGLFRFVLRSRTHALSELVTKLFARPTATSSTVTFTVHDLEDVTEAAEQASTTYTLRSEGGVGTWSGGTEDGTVDKLELRRHIQELLGGS